MSLLPPPERAAALAGRDHDRRRDERYVTRRQFTKFLVLTSFGMFVGQLWILPARCLARGRAPRAAAIGPSAATCPWGPLASSLPFAERSLPAHPDGPESYVAYSQKCTHLSCAVYFDAAKTRIECPCHEGAFSAADGRVLQGPPAAPLPRIRLQRRATSSWLREWKRAVPPKSRAPEAPACPRLRG
jgi:hypothetical protein